MRVSAVLLLPCLAVLAAASPAAATTYPRTCGTTVWKGQKYLIRSHLLTCSKAKPYAIAYIRARKRPSGWTCTRYPPPESIAFTCRRRNRDFLAIRK